MPGGTSPMDPAYPPERLAFMLEDSGVRVLVTEEPLLEALPAHTARVLCLDRDWSTIEEASEENLTRVTTPDGVAYAIYTSGSTGRPKCALLRHRGLCSLSEEQGRAFAVGPTSRVLQFSSFSFDASTFEIVMALPKGATLVLGDRDELTPGPDLLRFIRDRRITIVTLTPTAMAALPQAELPDLETITVAGEACPQDLVSRWAPGRRFFNLYGPTETTIWATVAELRSGDAPHIGRPIGNTDAYVLDAQLRPVPVGAPGELHIGGVGLARGYHRRPSLTDERFIAHPYSPGERLYKTGDRVRWRPDGNLEFLGRIDDQVKLRGHRIELGEIESVLSKHPAARDTVALLREDRPGHPQLTAYVVPRPEAVSQNELVSQWQSLYDDTYSSAPTPDETTFNVAGWNSSYTGEALAAEDMRQWVEGTVARILSTDPDRVLEIGCGTGLLTVPHRAPLRAVRGDGSLQGSPRLRLRAPRATR